MVERVLAVALVDRLGTVFGILERRNPPQREEFALVRFDLERAALVGRVAIPLRMLAEV